ncbi:50S ribosomal protein L37e [Candidatus Nanohalobium constans]|uniref:Large ribosomal subunit protein eL37 n=1 Tax=Candidatus Nanohalobium constans TaxID=2565781 RepID=A0A5Q0UHC2_9ARCH|nr:50S ribosomal protein L37e [Candidatus Nanohalobium constans]QGA80761.1 50S ribosomal protein L37e [Candidatus Nanohalobium constans]
MALNKGKRNKKVHGKCRRCGEKSFHLRKSECASCGFGKTKKRNDFDKAKPRKE